MIIFINKANYSSSSSSCLHLLTRRPSGIRSVSSALFSVSATHLNLATASQNTFTCPQAHPHYLFSTTTHHEPPLLSNTEARTAYLYFTFQHELQANSSPPPLPFPSRLLTATAASASCSSTTYVLCVILAQHYSSALPPTCYGVCLLHSSPA